jgi:hypothetical protein
MKHYSVTKVKDILLFVATWIELEIIKWNKPSTEKQVMHAKSNMEY